MIDRSSALEYSRRALDIARTEQLTLLSAGVAFYGFLSLVPLMLLALGIAASIGGETLAARLTAAAGDVLTPTAQQLLAETVLDEGGRQSATIVGAFGLIWGSSRVFRGLDRAFSKVYGTAATKSLLDTVWDAMIVFLVISGGLALVGILEIVLRFVPIIDLGPVGPVLVLLGLVVTFLPLYVVFPNANVGIREALPGTVLAAVGWFVLSRAFTVYASLASEQVIYGALGAVFLVLIWLYLGAIILVFGAVCNAVLADRELDRQLQSPRARQDEVEAMTDDATGGDEGGTDPADRSSTSDQPTDSQTRTHSRSSPSARTVTVRTIRQHSARRSNACATASRSSRATSNVEQSRKTRSRANSNGTSVDAFAAATPMAGDRISSCCMERP